MASRWANPIRARLLGILALGLVMGQVEDAAAQEPEAVLLHWHPAPEVPFRVVSEFSTSTDGVRTTWAQSTYRLSAGSLERDGLIPTTLVALDNRYGLGATEAEANASPQLLPSGKREAFRVSAYGVWYADTVESAGDPARIQSNPLELALELPKRAVAVGDEWGFASVIRSGRQVEFLQTLNATARLDSIGTEETRRIAYITVRGTYKWDGRGGFESGGEEQLLRRVKWDIDGGYPALIEGVSVGTGTAPPGPNGPTPKFEVYNRTRVTFAPEHPSEARPTP